jgi:hypothetical protein
MNPQSDQTPGLRLPQPSFDVGQASAPSAALPLQQPTQQFGQGMPLPSQASPVSSPQSAPVAPAAVQIPPQQSNPLAATATPVQESAQVDDESSLDKEWVAKAREVVERTHGDPYLEANELSRVKAQYIKVRYNKDIKVDED